MQAYLDSILAAMQANSADRMFCNIVADKYLVRTVKDGKVSLYFGTNNKACSPQGEIKAGFLSCHEVSTVRKHNVTVATDVMQDWLLQHSGKASKRPVAVSVGKVAVPATMTAAPMPIAQPAAQPAAQPVAVAAATRTITMAELQAFLASKGLTVVA